MKARYQQRVVHLSPVAVRIKHATTHCRGIVTAKVARNAADVAVRFICSECGGPLRVKDYTFAKPIAPEIVGIETAKALHRLKTGEEIDDDTAKELLQRDTPEDYD